VWLFVVGHGLCDSVCKSTTLAVATDNTDVISSECRVLVHNISFDPSDLRGVRSSQQATLVMCSAMRFILFVYITKLIY